MSAAKTFYEERRTAFIIFLSILAFGGGFVYAEPIFGYNIGISDQGTNPDGEPLTPSQYFESSALSSRLLVGAWSAYLTGSALHTFLPNPEVEAYLSRAQLNTYRQLPPAIGIWLVYRFGIDVLLRDYEENFQILNNIYVRLLTAAIVGGGGGFALNLVLDPM